MKAVGLQEGQPHTQRSPGSVVSNCGPFQGSQPTALQAPAGAVSGPGEFVGKLQKMEGGRTEGHSRTLQTAGRWGNHTLGNLRIQEWGL